MSDRAKSWTGNAALCLYLLKNFYKSILFGICNNYRQCTYFHFWFPNMTCIDWTMSAIGKLLSNFMHERSQIRQKSDNFSIFHISKSFRPIFVKQISFDKRCSIHIPNLKKIWDGDFLTVLFTMEWPIMHTIASIKTIELCQQNSLIWLVCSLMKLELEHLKT